MISFELSDEQKLVKDTVASFAADQIEPIMRESDDSENVRQDIISKGWGLGLLGGSIPEEYEGFGEEISALTGVIAIEELAWGDLSTALYLTAPAALALSVLDQGNEEQKKEILPAFTGEEYRPASCALVEPYFNFCPSALKAVAVRDGDEYVLNGKKCLVPLAQESESMIIFAATQPGMGFSSVDAFVVPAAGQGVTVSERERNMGIKALPTYQLELKDRRVPAASRLGGESGSDFLRLLSRSRLALAALAVGMSRRCVEYSRDYSIQRVAFGDPIASRQAIAFMVAEMAIEVDAARLLTWEAAWRCDKGMDFEKDAALAKNYAAEMAMMVCDRGVQIMGGHGYINENPVELWFRNARGFATFEGMVMV
ncbi:MAG: acyl-CoA dehydrogenase [Candidatus Solincola sediminis]|uniref:Acyl-CoA dehydrogenase n=1 Tax=Candidatus Solincola sediminis TaxID=1797199 RepID=A0A1F2WSA1_9ACTN|nr:MAG: acyl-CoA dehydrogenase [Candidatus Solincola sediminis]OFW61605.1 MAG: acyl-CoA dehydrogenase [Candidatus Solincola sediminis]